MFTSLRLERFKSFKDAELKLGPFNVLIGANASGKSNIRDAFRFLHGIGRGYSLADIIGEKYGEGESRVWTGIGGDSGDCVRGGFVVRTDSGETSCYYPLMLCISLQEGRSLEKRDLDYRIEIKVDHKAIDPPRGPRALSGISERVMS